MGLFFASVAVAALVVAVLRRVVPRDPRPPTEAEMRASMAEARERVLAQQSRLSWAIPEGLRRDPLTYEVDGSIDYSAFWEAEGKAPQALLRVFHMEFGEQAAAGAGAQGGLFEPGSPVWYFLVFGFSWAVPCPHERFQEALRGCEDCGAEAQPRGLIHPPWRFQEGAPPIPFIITVFTCDCGRGLGLWSALPEAEDGSPPSLVLALEPGPRDETFTTCIVAPPSYEDATPPMALVLADGELIGAIHDLRDRLVFSNDLNLDLMNIGLAPRRLEPEPLAALKAFIKAQARPLVARFRELRAAARGDAPAGRRSIWSLAGAPPPSPADEAMSEPVVTREWFGEAMREGRGRSPSTPLLVYQPAGERRFLRSLRCPEGLPFEFQREGSMLGTCPEPEGHEHLIPPEEEGDRVVVDKYRLQCECGAHSGVLYFDMYHPDEDPGFS